MSFEFQILIFLRHLIFDLSLSLTQFQFLCVRFSCLDGIYIPSLFYLWPGPNVGLVQSKLNFEFNLNLLEVTTPHPYLHPMPLVNSSKYFLHFWLWVHRRGVLLHVNHSGGPWNEIGYALEFRIQVELVETTLTALLILAYAFSPQFHAH